MCELRPDPRCAGDCSKDLAKARAAFEKAFPLEPVPDILRDGRRTMGALDAEYQVARRDARAADGLIRAAQARGESAEVLAALERHRDGAVCRALAAQEVRTGVWQEREATRAEHLAVHGPEVLSAQPADEPAQPARTDAWDPQTGRHSVTGSRFDEAGFDRDGYNRATQRDPLGYHRLTGTQLSPSGHLPDGTHITDHGLTREAVAIPTADNVVSGAVDLPPAPRPTSAAKAIADAKRAERGDQVPAKVAPAPVPAPVASVASAEPAPLRTKKSAAEALRTVGSRWTIETEARGVTPVTVVRSSSTSVWVRPDDAELDAKPTWLPIGDQSGWQVEADGIVDSAGQARIRRLAA